MQRCAVTFTAGTGSRRFELGPKTPRVSIGRSQQADLYVNSPRLSRTHCAVRLDPQGVVLEDLGSANGTFVNGQRVSRTLLRPGDIVQLGGVAIRVDFDAAAAPAVDLRCERCNSLVSMARCEDGHVFEMGAHFLCADCSALMRNQSLNQAEQAIVATLRAEGFEVEAKTPLSTAIVPVFRATRTGLGTSVSLKALPLVSGVSQKKVTRFQTEAKAAAKVRHPAVIEIYDIRQAKDCLYIVMEHVEGELLLGRIERHGPLPLAEGLRVALHVARALGVAHKLGIVHRDLKPGALVLTPEGLPKIADFGLAKDLWALTGSLTGPEETLGTVRYMPPEQVKNAREADARADIYSLGATLYHALVGKPPFHDRGELELMSAVLAGGLPPFDPGKADLPPRVAALIRRAMAQAPADRFQSAGELEQELGAAIAEHAGVPGFQGDPELLLRLGPSGGGGVDSTWKGAAPPAPGGMSGAFDGDELVELLQMIGFNGKTGVLTIHCGSLSGHLACQEGRIRAAVNTFGERGEPAALTLIATRSGRFELKPKLPPGFVAHMDAPVQSLLMEALRRRDEGAGARR